MKKRHRLPLGALLFVSRLNILSRQGDSAEALLMVSIYAAGDGGVLLRTM
jgi:hypothetical protein